MGVRRVRHSLEVRLIGAAILAGVASLAVLLAATRNTGALSAGLPWLLSFNALLLVVVAGLVLWQLRGMRQRLRAGVFGSRLMSRMVLLFTLMAVLPGAVVYGVSVYFLKGSIDSWFDVRIEHAIDGGLSLGRGAIDKLQGDLHRRGATVALELADLPPTQHYAQLSDVVERSGIREAALFDARGGVLMVVGGGIQQLGPKLPVTPLLATLRAQRQFSAVEATDGGGLMLRSVHWVTPSRPGAEPRILELLQPVPAEIAADADKVETGWSEYQSLTLARGGLKQLFFLSLTLTLLLAALIALAVAIVLADRLSAPLAQLGRGTAAVAGGDLSVQLKAHSRDEMGQLAGSFNGMTQQLREARASLIDQQSALAAANAHLQGLLENLSSGVLVFDRSLRLRSNNPLAVERLGLGEATTGELAALLAAPDHSPLAVLGAALCGQLRDRGDHWVLEHRLPGRQGERVLLLRGSRLDDAAGGGHVVVFDDITDVVQAQRDMAWAEVARRLAHEIKNPLTPIRLSAERLEHKLTDRLSADDAAVLHRATRTIVNQVDAMKDMVRDFADFARPVSAQPLVAVDLAALLDEVLGLYGDLEPMLERRIATGLPAVAGHPTQLRQVFHNVLTNAKDALEGQTQPRLSVSLQPATEGIELCVTDNGSGFPEALMTRAFEPYTTTKERGTGLGLAIVRKVVEAHGGSVEIGNIEPHGARVTITLPVGAET
ncbi:MAG: HAMP domain-containing protein [Betaproteobacteria bacterium]|jgi:nitrogen fixation/metabolism regulation signal transduction histidine kinase|nr:HAMP domain-containing protein [Betaproteobacteria bacterium]NBY52685.1 HAMP domain-containing protein [Betaproteobacteria bacterium]NCU85388.1 HAMP domain-containing protein [Betaproteobacteria bacterium]NDF70712.1 HAMP domain-containing protein [Betaproteobacteria bacterium]